MKVLFSIVLSLIFSIAHGQVASRALYYDGANQYTTLGNPTNLQLDHYTIELWFYGEDNTRSILTRGTSKGANTARTFDLYGDGTQLILFLNDGVGSSGHFHILGNYVTGQWNHVSIVKDTSKNKITTLLNGGSPVQTDLLITPAKNLYDWHIGGNGSFSHKGRIDELRMWETTRDLNLVQDKIHSRYYGWTRLNGSYNFNQTTGSVLPDLDAPDEDGTNVNMADSNWVPSYAPIGNTTSRAQDHQRGLWTATDTNYTIDSDGLSMSVNTPLTEQNYATFGHNNRARLNAVTTADLPSGVLERYEQVWYVDEYGTVTANLIFDLHKIWGITLNVGTANNYCLLYRSGTSGAFTELAIIPSLANTAEIIFPGLLLADGYYALGTKNSTSSPIQTTLTVGQSYFGNNSYIEYIPGDLPILVVAPHGGTLQPSHLPIVLNRNGDGGSQASSRMIMDSMMLYTNGCRPHVIINHLYPNRFVATGDVFGAAGFHPETQQAWSDFQNFIEIAKTKVTDDWGAGHYFEIHTSARVRNQIGLGLSATALSEPDSTLATRASSSTVKNLCTAGGADFLQVLKGPNSFGSLLQDRNWDSSPSYDDPNPSAPFYLAGKNTWDHGSNRAGTIDASHVESYYGYINYASNRPRYSGDLAASMITFVEIFYGFTLDCSNPTGTKKVPETKLINVFPNPCNKEDRIYFSDEVQITHLRLFTITGIELDAPKLMDGYLPQTILPGIYVVYIELESGTIQSTKIRIN